jgi:hypothetical protein
MKTRNLVTLIGAIIFLVCGILILRPVPVRDEKDCLVVSGKVIELFEDGIHDVVFRLEGQDRSFM